MIAKKCILFALNALLWNIVTGFMSMSSTNHENSRRQFIYGSVGVASLIISPAISLGATSSEVYETKNGIKYIVKKEGKGAAPLDGDYAVIQYIGYLNNGKAFDINDGTVQGRKPTVFKLGAKQVIPAWEEIVRYMRPGSEFNIVVPPSLGFGEKGVCVENGECLVPPNETLKYSIKLEKVAISP